MVLSVGVVGTGNIGSYHIERLAGRLSGVRVSAVFDVATQRAEQIADSIGARAHAEGMDLVADDDVDAVVITSPGPTHAEFVLACIGAGKPVLSEKPLATTVDDCEKVLEAEIAHGSRLAQVGFMRRYDHGYGQLKAAIDDGSIGEPLIVHCVHRNATVPEAFTSDMSQTDSVVHEIDTARWLLGEEFTTATVLRPRRSPLAAEHLQDPQLVLLENEAGVIVEVESFVNAQYGYDVRCEVVGSEGTVELETPSVASLTREGQRGRSVPTDWKERFDDAFHVEFQQWVDGLGSSTVSGPSAWDGYAATAVSVTCVEALNSGRRTPIHLREKPALYR
ncbi:MAG: Gfo/Idh/MocA family oxidoreductase [Egibacteraceae bacterium]